MRYPNSTPIFQPTLPPEGSKYNTSANSISPPKQFQPTLPLRGATVGQARHTLQRRISTHAPPEGSSNYRSLGISPGYDFNPRSPEGSDLAHDVAGLLAHISTHAPLRGATAPCMYSRTPALFQPTLPLRGATIVCNGLPVFQDISTHAPPEGSRFLSSSGRQPRAAEISTHAPLRGATFLTPLHTSCCTFQRTLPLRGATPCTPSTE